MITVTDLLAKIRIASKIPKSQLSDSDLLSIATDILYSRLIAQVTSTNEYFYRQVVEVDVSSNSYTYRFPPAAVGGGLIDVLHKATSTSTDYSPLSQYRVEDKRTKSYRNGFILTAGGLELWPRPTSDWIMEVHYLLRPGKLTKEINTAKVVSVGDGTLELTSIPSSINSTVAIDVMKSDGMAERVIIDADIQSISGSTLTLVTSSEASKASVGDTVALTGYSPYAQLPDEFIEYFVALVAQKVAIITGDNRLHKTASMMVEDSKPDILNITSPRVDEEIPGISIEWS